MNLLPGRVVRAHDGAAVELPAGVILPLARRTGVTPDETLDDAGIRPEHFEWAPAGQAAAIEAPAADRVSPLGSDTLVGISLGEHNLQVRLPPRRVRRAGELVRLNVAPGTCTCSTGDGRRIAADGLTASEDSACPRQ